MSADMLWDVFAAASVSINPGATNQDAYHTSNLDQHILLQGEAQGYA